MAGKQSTAFTARETELLTIAFQCIKEKPVIDYELMAAKAGLKGAKSARDSFGPLYNKILSGQKMATANGEGPEQSGEPSPKKKATPSKRKAVDGGKEDDDDENASPTKKKKAAPGKAKGKAKGKKKAVTDAEGEDDTIAVKSELVEQDGVDI